MSDMKIPSLLATKIWIKSNIEILLWDICSKTFGNPNLDPVKVRTGVLEPN
jgi:hypothetical protein